LKKVKFFERRWSYSKVLSMSDSLRPLKMNLGPLRVQQRGEGHGRGRQDQGQQDSQGQSPKLKKKPGEGPTNPPEVSTSPLQNAEDFENLLQGKH
jgi:hypothetical protein